MHPKDFPFRNFEWKLLTQCNYNCWYCLEEGDRTKKCPSAEQVNTYANAIISNLREPWVIQITGGEPFLNADFIIGLSEKLVAKGHWIKIFTNLSANMETYNKFIEVTSGKLYKLKASFHLENAIFEDFLKKAVQIKKAINSKAKFKIFSVILPGVDKIKLLKKYSDIFIEEGLDFDVIHMIDQNTKQYHHYTEEEQRLIEEYFSKCTNDIELKYEDGLCRSGYSYFALTQELKAWSCWDARFKNDISRYYGNLLKGSFTFPNERKTCPYKKCNYPNGVEEYIIR